LAGEEGGKVVIAGEGVGCGFGRLHCGLGCGNHIWRESGGVARKRCGAASIRFLSLACLSSA
jgi:hypothetical protein